MDRPAKESHRLGKDASSLEFARSLAADLRAVGIMAHVRVGAAHATLSLPAALGSDGRTPLNPRSIRAARVRRAGGPVPRIDESPLVRLLADGSEFQIDRVRPRLRVCVSRSDFELYNQCRLLQSVSNSQRIGRQIRVLVFDDGQRGRAKLLGAFGLASPTYALACRDSFLGWRGQSVRSVKEQGLRRTMDLAVCVAMPPYSYFLGGKLLAALALSQGITREFERKYDDVLLGATTSCATGIHCPIFHRIMVRPGGLYRRIGETAGWTLSWVSAKTLQIARRLQPETGDSNDILSFGSKPLIVMRRALKHIGVPYGRLLRLGQPKAVYFGAHSQENVQALRTGQLDGIMVAPSVDETFGFWEERILKKRINSVRAWAMARDFQPRASVSPVSTFGGSR